MLKSCCALIVGLVVGLTIGFGMVGCARFRIASFAITLATFLAFQGITLILIGGTSLFGGHGRVIDAVLGGLVVPVIVNGMSDLIQGANSSGYEYVVTGLVLLVAAGFDAVVRHGRPG